MDDQFGCVAPPTTLADHAEKSLPERTPEEVELTLSEFDVIDSDTGRSLGKGSFGVVRRVQKRSSGEVFALKTMQKAVVIESELVDQVEREIQVQRALKHENILKLYKHFQDPETVYLLLEYCAKGELYQLLRTHKNRRFPEETTRHYFMQVAKGLQHLHSQHIVHRDLKLENVLISKTTMSSGTPQLELHDVKIADLGLSKSIGSSGAGRDDGPQMVRRNSIVGSPDFVAPEVLEAHYDERADLWSLGVMLYAMFCGQWPFEISSPEHLRPQMHKQIVGCVKETDSWHLVSEAGKNLVHGLLKVDPEERCTLEAMKTDPWLNPDQAADQVSVPREFEAEAENKAAITKFGGWLGAAVDSVTLKFWDGGKQYHGSSGGEVHKEWHLDPDEIVIAVMSEMRGKYLGNGLTFFTNKPRVLSVSGKDAKSRSRFIAPRGHEIVGLQFDDSRLIGIIIERMSAESKVKEIHGKIGYAVDSVSLTMNNGEVRYYGAPGGKDCGPFFLAKDEYIVIVEQAHRDAFLGKGIIFYTSAGNIFKLMGMEDCDTRRYACAAGNQICGLHFNGDVLEYVDTCPATGNLTDKATHGTL
mmetsp:Transcript_21361/g.46375  ORF Transcript_21361/g.46375 Transcript_21361/m.46375 type:complete len:586 (+) Transcript_21361:347-2104(+)